MISKLTSELDDARSALQRSEAQNKLLWAGVYQLRQELLSERTSRQAAVSRLWDDIAFLHVQLQSGPGAAGGFMDPEEDIDSPWLSHGAKVAQLGSMVKVHHAVQRWWTQKERSQERTRSFIVARAWNWIDRARSAARLDLCRVPPVSCVC
jgi:hypothetical protein